MGKRVSQSLAPKLLVAPVEEASPKAERDTGDHAATRYRLASPQPLDRDNHLLDPGRLKGVEVQQPSVCQGFLWLILAKTPVDRVADDDLEIVDQLETGRRNFCVLVV